MIIKESQAQDDNIWHFPISLKLTLPVTFVTFAMSVSPPVSVHDHGYFTNVLRPSSVHK